MRHRQPALTGFEMMQIVASGQCWAQAAVRVATIVALVLNRSSRVMPANDPIQGVHKAQDEFPNVYQVVCVCCYGKFKHE